MTICVECGCTDDNACPEGCYWLMKREDNEVGICSMCEDAFEGMENDECLAILDGYEERAAITEAEQLADGIFDAIDREDPAMLILSDNPTFYPTLRGGR